MLDIQEVLKNIAPYVEEDDDDLLVCRCEEVTKGAISRLPMRPANMKTCGLDDEEGK